MDTTTPLKKPYLALIDMNPSDAHLRPWRHTCRQLFLLPVVALCVASCSTGGHPPHGSAQAQERPHGDSIHISTTRSIPAIDPVRFADALRPLLMRDSTRRDALIWTLRQGPVVQAYYRDVEFAARWTREGVESALFTGVFELLADSDVHGIPPARYHVGDLRKLTAAWQSAWSRNGSIDYPMLAQIDLLMSDAVVTHAADLKFGVVHPKSAYSDDYSIRIRNRSGYESTDPLLASDPLAFLREVQPQDERYTRLQSALQMLKRLAAFHTPVQLPQIEGKIVPGDRHAIIARLRERMRTEWMLDALPLLESDLFLDARRLIELADSSTAPHAGAARIDQYDDRLAYAVRLFQERNGLAPDSVIGRGTIKALNWSLEDRMQKVRLNLERFRWNSYPTTGRYVLVNIPDFHVSTYQDGRQLDYIKICVGKRSGHETPMLSSDVTFVILNPVWSVPFSIASKETYKMASKDPTYLARNNYRVYRNDTLISPSAINFKALASGRFPYRFVQGSGDGNALGRIKFSFYNPHNVYLHDTPVRRPFKMASRDVSHGCVRVEKPKRLVDFLLKDHSAWDMDKVNEYLGQTHAGKVIKLDEKVPIHLDYITAWVDDAGRLQLRDDIYRRDADILRAWKAAMQPPMPPAPAPLLPVAVPQGTPASVAPAGTRTGAAASQS